jgi:hypothetical protein
MLPPRFNAMLEQALCAVGTDDQRDELCVVACVLSSATWQHWQAWRLPEDNRQEHEWIVFANVMRIAEGENLSLSEKRIATAVAFTHDSYAITRITERSIRLIDEEAAKVRSVDLQRFEELTARAASLREEKKRQRIEHMEGGAENASFLLRRLKRPPESGGPLLSSEEVERCVSIVRGHDLWKTGEPRPVGADRLAVSCLEADALWPLHPLGVLADVERSNDEAGNGLYDPAAWKKQLRNSLKTLSQYRANWPASVEESFADSEFIFRTQEGYRMFCEWRRFWNI